MRELREIPTRLDLPPWLQHQGRQVVRQVRGMDEEGRQGDKKENKMNMTWHNAVYRTEKAKANRDVCGFSQMCYGAGKKPCAFLCDDGKCNKPAEFPRCFEVNPTSGVTHGHVWMRVASDPFRTEFVRHPKADHLCFGCGCLMPGVGSENTKSEQLKTEGCAHFKLTGTDSDGVLKEWRVCVVCMMAMLDAGGMLDSGRFKPRYATRRDRKAYLDVLRECQREGVEAAMRRRGLMADADAEMEKESEAME